MIGDVSYSTQLLIQLYLLSASGLGAIFAILYPLTTAVSAGTYDENDNARYVVHVVVGLISGTILGQLLPIDSVGALGDLTRPTLALLGGFSASLVYKILTQLVRAVENVFSDSETSAATAAAAAANAEAMISRERQTLARELIELRRQLPQAAVALDAVIDRLLRGQS